MLCSVCYQQNRDVTNLQNRNPPPYDSIYWFKKKLECWVTQIQIFNTFFA